MINAVLQRSYKCTETSELNFFSWTWHVYNNQKFRQTCDSNKSVQIWRKVSLTQIFVGRLRLKQGREIQDFMFWGKEFRRDAQAKDMLVLNKSSLALAPRSYSWVSVVWLVTNKELCHVSWGIIIKNLCINILLLSRTVAVGFKIPSVLIFCSIDRKWSGRINMPTLRCREFNVFKCTSAQPSYTTDA